MHEPQSSDQRIAKLEEIITFQEEAISAMNRSILDQAKEIEILQRTCEVLSTKIKLVQTEISEHRPAEDERPPHY